MVRQEDGKKKTEKVKSRNVRDEDERVLDVGSKERKPVSSSKLPESSSSSSSESFQIHYGISYK